MKIGKNNFFANVVLKVDWELCKTNSQMALNTVFYIE